MLKPDLIGRKSFYLNPANIQFSTAEMAAIDSTYAMATVSPYAQSAIVRDDYDAANFHMADAGSNIVSAKRVAFGLFLSPENDKGNLLFQVSGRAVFQMNTITSIVRGSFFFGRKATNNTVVSSKAAESNTLAAHMLLPSKSEGPAFATEAGQLIHQSIESEVFTLALAGGYVYCFGFLLDNVGGADVALKGGVSLSVRKYSSELPVFMPSR